MKAKPKRKTCQQYLAERIEANRDREVEQGFSLLERELLNAPTQTGRQTTVPKP
jgi:hypothetical protein